MWKSEERAPQAERVATAKVLRQECAWNNQGIAWRPDVARGK